MYANSLVFVSLLASTVAGLGVPGLPKCAGGCVTGFGGCQDIDVKCICSNKPLLTHLACCVSKNCSKKDQDATIQFADSLCAGQGVSDLPQTATCPATASSSTAAAASTASISSSMSMSSSTDTATTMAAGTTGQNTQENPSASSSQSSAASSASSSASASATAAGSNGANGNKVEGFGLGMVVAGLIAAI